MRPFRLDLDVDNVDPDGLADNNASSGGTVTLDGALISGLDTDGLADNNDSSGTSVTMDGALTSNGRWVASDNEGHYVQIKDTATVDQSGALFTLIGKDRLGNPLQEGITGPGSGATVVSTNLFREISQILVADGAACGTVDIGPRGVYISADGFGHKINIIDTATVDQSGSTFNITGVDADNRTQLESVTGPGSGATVESSKYFKVVHKITITSATACGTVDVGTVDEFSSHTIPLDHYSDIPPTLQVDVTGTINFDIQVTLHNVFDLGSAAPFDHPDQESFNWLNDSNFGAKTASLIDDLAQAGARAIRVVSNSFTDGAELQVYGTQPRSQ